MNNEFIKKIDEIAEKNKKIGEEIRGMGQDTKHAAFKFVGSLKVRMENIKNEMKK